jgi:hypothetical protein
MFSCEDELGSVTASEHAPEAQPSPRSVLNVLNTMSVDTHSVPSRRSTGGIFATSNSQQRPRFYQTPLVADRRLAQRLGFHRSIPVKKKSNRKYEARFAIFL